jgi:predicted secreted protein
MAALVGYGGKVDWSTVVSDVGYDINAWKLDFTAEALDSTDFSSVGWRTFIAGLKQWGGSVEAFVDGAAQLTIADVGSSAAIKLYNDTNHYFTGTALCTGVHPSVSVEGIQTQTLDFQGTGALIYSDLA